MKKKDKRMQNLIDAEVAEENKKAKAVEAAEVASLNVTPVPTPGVMTATLSGESPLITSIGWVKQDKGYSVYLIKTQGKTVVDSENLCIDPATPILPRMHAENLLRVEVVRRLIMGEDQGDQENAEDEV